MYLRIYTMLKRSGHSTNCALQILDSAMRGDDAALKWIVKLHGLRHL